MTRFPSIPLSLSLCYLTCHSLPSFPSLLLPSFIPSLLYYLQSSQSPLIAFLHAPFLSLSLAFLFSFHLLFAFQSPSLFSSLPFSLSPSLPLSLPGSSVLCIHVLSCTAIDSSIHLPPTSTLNSAFTQEDTVLRHRKGFSLSLPLPQSFTPLLPCPIRKPSISHLQT